MTTKEPKKEPTKEELETRAVGLAEQDNSLTEQINDLTKERNGIRKERRSVEGRLLTMKINEQVK